VSDVALTFDFVNPNDLSNIQVQAVQSPLNYSFYISNSTTFSLLQDPSASSSATCAQLTSGQWQASTSCGKPITSGSGTVTCSCSSTGTFAVLFDFNAPQGNTPSIGGDGTPGGNEPSSAVFDEMPAGAKAGIAIGVIVVVGGVAAGVAFYVWKTKQIARTKDTERLHHKLAKMGASAPETTPTNSNSYNATDSDGAKDLADQNKRWTMGSKPSNLNE